MSVYYVVQWSVRPVDVGPCQDQLAIISSHVKAQPPGIKSIRTFPQAWGPLPRRAYLRFERG